MALLLPMLFLVLPRSCAGFYLSAGVFTRGVDSSRSQFPSTDGTMTSLQSVITKAVLVAGFNEPSVQLYEDDLRRIVQNIQTDMQKKLGHLEQAYARKLEEERRAMADMVPMETHDTIVDSYEDMLKGSLLELTNSKRNALAELKIEVEKKLQSLQTALQQEETRRIETESKLSQSVAASEDRKTQTDARVKALQEEVSLLHDQLRDYKTFMTEYMTQMETQQVEVDQGIADVRDQAVTASASLLSQLQPLRSALVASEIDAANLRTSFEGYIAKSQEEKLAAQEKIRQEEVLPLQVSVEALRKDLATAEGKTKILNEAFTEIRAELQRHIDASNEEMTAVLALNEMLRGQLKSMKDMFQNQSRTREKERDEEMTAVLSLAELVKQQFIQYKAKSLEQLSAQELRHEKELAAMQKLLADKDELIATYEAQMKELATVQASKLAAELTTTEPELKAALMASTPVVLNVDSDDDVTSDRSVTMQSDGRDQEVLEARSALAMEAEKTLAQVLQVLEASQAHVTWLKTALDKSLQELQTRDTIEEELRSSLVEAKVNVQALRHKVIVMDDALVSERERRQAEEATAVRFEWKPPKWGINGSRGTSGKAGRGLARAQRRSSPGGSRTAGGGRDFSPNTKA